MSRFFFHLRSDDGRIDDLEGTEIPDLASARAEALDAARQILSEKMKAGAVLEEQTFELTDEGGCLLDVVSLELAIRSRFGMGSTMR